MAGEITVLLDIAMDREIASEAFYIAGQTKTQDPGAIALMREMAREEAQHYEWIKNLKEKGLQAGDWYPEKLPALMISEYLIDINLTEGAGLQDVITVAMKREQYSVEFYSKLQQAMKSKAARLLCERLAQNERNHKTKLEIFYDNYFYQED